MKIEIDGWRLERLVQGGSDDWVISRANIPKAKAKAKDPDKVVVTRWTNIYWCSSLTAAIERMVSVTANGEMLAIQGSWEAIRGEIREFTGGK